MRPALRSCLLAIVVAGTPAGTPAHADDTLVVALGASSTAGRGVDPAEAYPAQLQAMLAADGYRTRVVNAGRNGDTSAGMRARLDAAVPDGTGLVILQRGTNDAGGGDHDANIAGILDRLRARGIRVVLLPTRLMRDLRAGHAQDDGHHLTAEGYHILAERLLPQVERAIERDARR